MFHIFKFIIFFALLVSSNTFAKTIAVSFDYNSTFDDRCSKATSAVIKDEWKQELLSKRKQLADDWNAYGEKLLSTTEKIVGSKFSQQAVVARLTLCNTPSRSDPLTVNMRYALSTFTDSPVPIYIKTATLYHELLHPYVLENIMRDSTLLSLYETEEKRIIQHLHLLALIKAVYLELGMTDKLNAIIAIDSALPNGFYKRAWAIINSSSSYYLEFIRELQHRS